MAVLDRSWYGRVLVERVEGFATDEQWQRAYDEIVDFERTLVAEGMILVKFWMHLSPEEQQRRFDRRKDDPLKSWKLTDEDWRNREKHDQYVDAVEDMLDRTDHPAAPWYVVPAEDKRYARVAVVRTVCEAIERATDQPTSEVGSGQVKPGGTGRAALAGRRPHLLDHRRRTPGRRPGSASRSGRADGRRAPRRRRPSARTGSAPTAARSTPGAGPNRPSAATGGPRAAARCARRRRRGRARSSSSSRRWRARSSSSRRCWPPAGRRRSHAGCDRPSGR